MRWVTSRLSCSGLVLAPNRTVIPCGRHGSGHTSRQAYRQALELDPDHPEAKLNAAALPRPGETKDAR